jgi:hypothetical protein
MQNCASGIIVVPISDGEWKSLDFTVDYANNTHKFISASVMSYVKGMADVRKKSSREIKHRIIGMVKFA